MVVLCWWLWEVAESNRLLSFPSQTTKACTGVSDVLPGAARGPHGWRRLGKFDLKTTYLRRYKFSACQAVKHKLGAVEPNKETRVIEILEILFLQD
jgi:hypothetical protein